MGNPILILIGSQAYSHNYFRLIKKLRPKLGLLVVDKTKKPKKELPNRALFLSVDPKTALKEISQYIRNRGLQVVAVVNRTDYFEVLHGEIAEKFKVPGPKAKSVRSLSDKAWLHKLMTENELDFFRPRTIVTTLPKAKKYLETMQFPAVLKSHVGAKSRGVVTLKSAKEFETARKIVGKHLDNPNKEPILIEQFLYGKQVTPTMYVDSLGKVHILALVDVTTAREAGQNHMQLVYRTTPSVCSEKIRQKITYVMQQLVTISGLRSTPMHPEFFVVGKHVYLIEVNVRIGGFRDTLMQSAYNIDLDKLSLELALDLPVSDIVTAKSSCTACEVWDERSGKLKELRIPRSKYIISQTYISKLDNVYLAPPNAQVPLARFFVQSSEESLSLAKKLRKLTRIVLDDN